MKVSGHQPNLWMFAGPNGAGKTTLAGRYLMTAHVPMLNPDTIAKEYQQQNSDLTLGQAYRRSFMFCIEEQKRLLEARTSFSVETTLAGWNSLELLEKAKANGFRLNLFFVGLDSADLSNSRVTLRVQRGGHDIPERVVFGRYPNILKHLPTALKLADRIRVFDNSGRQHRLLLSRTNGKNRYCSPEQPDWLTHSL